MPKSCYILSLVKLKLVGSLYSFPVCYLRFNGDCGETVNVSRSYFANYTICGIFQNVQFAPIIKNFLTESNMRRKPHREDFA